VVDPAGTQAALRNLESAALAEEEVLDGNADILEDDLTVTL
jgi:hypothetical protein